jgi:hypothetical protein
MMSRIKSRPGCAAAVSFVITFPGVVTPAYVAHPGTAAKALSLSDSGLEGDASASE